MSNPIQISTTSDSSIADYIAKYRAAQASDPYRRLLLVGESGAGKTYSVLTTLDGPIIYADVDDGLTGVPELTNLARFDFTNYDRARKIISDKSIECTFDSVFSWLRNDVPRLVTQANGQLTVVIDSISVLGDTLMAVLETCPETLKNKFYLWQQWSTKWRDLSTAIKQLRCNVIVIAHEQAQYEYINDKPKIVEYSFYLPGNQFSQRFPQFFTDCARQIRVVKQPPTNMQMIAFPDASLAKTSPQVETRYMWQIQPELLRPWIKTRSKRKDLVIDANWKELIK